LTAVGGAPPTPYQCYLTHLLQNEANKFKRNREEGESSNGFKI